MRVRAPQSPASPVLWYAVLGAPVAWAAQFGISYWMTQAKCSVAGERWGISVDAWTIGLTVLSVGMAVGAGLVALGLLRATAQENAEGAPPGGRTRFFALVGLAVTPLFLAIIVLNGIGVAIQGCGQS
jgi:hypothetical protein